jgi:hypothetical protein
LTALSERPGRKPAGDGGPLVGEEAVEADDLLVLLAVLEINHAKVWPWCVQVVRVWRAGRVCVEDVACVRGMRSRRCLLGL